MAKKAVFGNFEKWPNWQKTENSPSLLKFSDESRPIFAHYPAKIQPKFDRNPTENWLNSD